MANKHPSSIEAIKDWIAMRFHVILYLILIANIITATLYIKGDIKISSYQIPAIYIPILLTLIGFTAVSQAKNMINYFIDEQEELQQKLNSKEPRIPNMANMKIPDVQSGVVDKIEAMGEVEAMEKFMRGE